MKKLLLAVLLVPATGHAGDVVRDATPNELAAIKVDLEMKLKDAGSAKLQRIKVNGNDFCGMVDAKNSFGAYAGYSPIMGMVFKDATGKQLAAVMGLDMPDVTRQECENKGMPLPPS